MRSLAVVVSKIWPIEFPGNKDSQLMTLNWHWTTSSLNNAIHHFYFIFEIMSKKWEIVVYSCGIHSRRIQKTNNNFISHLRTFSWKYAWKWPFSLKQDKRKMKNISLSPIFFIHSLLLSYTYLHTFINSFFNVLFISFLCVFVGLPFFFLFLKRLEHTHKSVYISIIIIII